MSAKLVGLLDKSMAAFFRRCGILAVVDTTSNDVALSRSQFAEPVGLPIIEKIAATRVATTSAPGLLNRLILTKGS
jgi:hypothetical protein